MKKLCGIERGRSINLAIIGKEKSTRWFSILWNDWFLYDSVDGKAFSDQIEGSKKLYFTPPNLKMRLYEPHESKMP